jgi:hypothetical protein
VEGSCAVLGRRNRFHVSLDLMAAFRGSWWADDEDGTEVGSGGVSAGPSLSISAGWARSLTRGSDVGLYVGYLTATGVKSTVDDAPGDTEGPISKMHLLRVGGLIKLYLTSGDAFMVGVHLEAGMLVGTVGSGIGTAVGAGGTSGVFVDLPLSKKARRPILTIAVGASAGIVGASSDTAGGRSTNFPFVMFPQVRLGFAYGS